MNQMGYDVNKKLASRVGREEGGTTEDPPLQGLAPEARCSALRGSLRALPKSAGTIIAQSGLALGLHR